MDSMLTSIRTVTISSLLGICLTCQPALAVSVSCPDVDSDSICDDVDNCPIIPNTNQADIDNDSLGDVCDSTINGPLFITGPAMYSTIALGTVGTDGNVTIDSGADVTIQSLKTILNPGFHAKENSSLHVIPQ